MEVFHNAETTAMNGKQEVKPWCNFSVKDEMNIRERTIVCHYRTDCQVKTMKRV